jgi:protein-tyrosine phosphatase
MKALQLRGARNFRSLIETPTRDGRRIAGHTLLRSDQLHALGPADWDVLTALGLRAVCDLRSEEERARYPNKLPPEVRQLPLAVVADIRSDVHYAALLREAPNAVGATRVMDAIYRRLPAALAPHLPAMFGLLETGDVPVLIHCAAGKDRTGVAVALLLHALGVGADDILADYLRSSPAQRAHDGEHLHKMDRMTREAVGVACTPEMVEVLLDARPEWLQAAFASAAETHGSVERYLEVIAGLDAAALARSRDAWLS